MASAAAKQSSSRQFASVRQFWHELETVSMADIDPATHELWNALAGTGPAMVDDKKAVLLEIDREIETGLFGLALDLTRCPEDARCLYTAYKDGQDHPQMAQFAPAAATIDRARDLLLKAHSLIN